MAHLRDFMRNGREFFVAVIDPTTGEAVDVPIWIQRPSSIQQEDCLKKANVVGAKMRASFRDPTNDDYVVLHEEISELPTEDLERIILRSKAGDLLRQANQEVMYGDIGSKWDGVDEETGEGIDITAIIEAMAGLYERYNDPESGLASEASDDPELKNLLEIQQKFEAEVDARAKELQDEAMAPYRSKDREGLVQAAMKEAVNNAAQLAWYGEYRNWQLFYGCREPDDHKKFYFTSLEEVLDLPDTVRMSLMVFYDQVDGGPDNTKELPTPVDSSPSSE